MSNTIFSKQAWEEYCYWQKEDKKTLNKINRLIKDIQRNSFEGLGKPEPLKDNYSGLWSRRIDEINRLVYRVEEDGIDIYQVKGHYDDK